MKKSIISILASVLVLGNFMGCANDESNATDISEETISLDKTSYIVNYTAASADLISDICSYLEEEMPKVNEFMGIDKPAQKLKIYIYPTLDSWKKHLSDIGMSYEEWIVGHASNWQVHMLNFHEYKKLQSHKNDTFDHYKKTVVHEYVHNAHFQIKTSTNSCGFLNEGIASHLAQQYDTAKINLSAYSDDYFFKSSGYSYAVTQAAIEKMVTNMSHEEFLKYLKDANYYYNNKESLIKLWTDRELKKYEWKTYNDGSLEFYTENPAFSGSMSKKTLKTNTDSFEAFGKQDSGAAASGYGFFFAMQDWQNFYRIRITYDGSLYIQIRKDGTYNYLVNSENVDCIKTGLSQSNNFAVKNNSGKLECYINSNLVYTIENPEWTTGEVAAYGAASPATSLAYNPVRLKYLLNK
ncbi:MAG: hypothetical protein KBT11_11350 [Treponema sp.]|nr:hypothetical protein [Candidatus Treponema equifaecale]